MKFRDDGSQDNDGVNHFDVCCLLVFGFLWGEDDFENNNIATITENI